MEADNLEAALSVLDEYMDSNIFANNDWSRKIMKIYSGRLIFDLIFVLLELRIPLIGIIVEK